MNTCVCGSTEIVWNGLCQSCADKQMEDMHPVYLEELAEMPIDHDNHPDPDFKEKCCRDIDAICNNCYDCIPF